MARNKYPEETVEKILDVSMRLFMEKGYENTSIQDIIDNLGGLSKGAIYHHFKSKEDIILAVLDKQFENHDAEWMRIVHENKNMNGLEKLRAMFLVSTRSPRQEEVFRSAPSMLQNPKMLVLQLKGIMEESVPVFIQPIIEEGMKDGSIQTQYPKELAEIILLLVNLWVTPMVFPAAEEEIERRIAFFKQSTKLLGADFMDDELCERFKVLAQMYSRGD